MTHAWREQVVIPTYEAGQPEKNPIFLEKRVYQGSSGVVYPYPVIESIADEKTDHTYNAIFMENEYLKIMVLPELGGRIQMAYDKVRQRHFIYYNHVIKPALVGLAGPWISGGIEFNWPQHHRPSTFMPVDATIEEHPDGSVTVWVNEVERMFHQKGLAAFTLRPGCAYLEIKGQLSNGTAMPQTFLWWANPAVAVGDHYQSVFPPDVRTVFDHGKRAVSSFPVATGTYYKVDYSAGVDISNYRNIPVPTSYMIAASRFDFEGGYENDTRAGMLHVADHHIAPGKKQWTWGNGDFGRAWDRNLTDSDGPYIELMAGVFTENQPDFTWLQPYEEKRFTQYFLPYRELGVVKNASKDLLLNIEPDGEGYVRIKVFATSRQDISVTLATDDGRPLYHRSVSLSPENLLDERVATNEAFDHLTLTLERDGRTVLAWHDETDDVLPQPDAAQAALRPEETKTVEQLYLTGLHLEQYRHATWSPIDYYEEGLRRDPDDIRCNNALGLWYLRHARPDKAEPYLRRAVARWTQRNPNPYDGEPLYNLGITLGMLHRYDEAYDVLYKATWNAAWQDSAHFACARIACRQGRWTDALDHLDNALIRNSRHHKARALQVTLLRLSGRHDEALTRIAEALAVDPFNYGCLYERYLLTGAADDLERAISLWRNEAHNYDEVATDYLEAGRFDEAAALWRLAARRGNATPMTFYYLAYTLRQGGMEGSDEVLAQARTACPDACFPNSLAAAAALSDAIAYHADDARAAYYLGCLYYDKRQYDLARKCWQQAADADPAFPTVWRNLALYHYNKGGDAAKALTCMERAYALDTTDARVLMELDQLRKRLNHEPAQRLAFLNSHAAEVQRRDDLALETATLLNQTGQYAAARQTMDSRIFHPWEGGEGKVVEQYLFARMEMAKQALADGRTDEVQTLLEECLVRPHHLGEGKLIGEAENDVRYLLGCAAEARGCHDEAMAQWHIAAQGTAEPAAAIYYNDARPEKIFYQGLALQRTGRDAEARGRFHALVTYGEKHLFDRYTPDFFAVSLPDLLVWDDDMDRRSRFHCLYMMALGHTGLGHAARAARFIAEARELYPYHQGLQALHSLTHTLMHN